MLLDLTAELLNVIAGFCEPRDIAQLACSKETSQLAQHEFLRRAAFRSFFWGVVEAGPRRPCRWVESHSCGLRDLGGTLSKVRIGSARAYAEMVTGLSKPARENGRVASQ